MTAPHHSVFTGRMHNQQRKSTEGKNNDLSQAAYNSNVSQDVPTHDGLTCVRLEDFSSSAGDREW